MEFLNDVGFFRIAKDEANKSTHEFKMGAVLVRKRPIARGHNVEKTHPIYANPEKHLGISIHAEIACLIDAAEISGDTIYVYREDKQGLPAMARPCNNCQNALRNYGIKKMIYSIPHPPYYAEEAV